MVPRHGQGTGVEYGDRNVGRINFWYWNKNETEEICKNIRPEDHSSSTKQLTIF
jgi:hypothetical protein